MVKLLLDKPEKKYYCVSLFLQRDHQRRAEMAIIAKYLLFNLVMQFSIYIVPVVNSWISR